MRPAVASIVVSGLLFLVVDILRIEQRETRLDQVQQDSQRALDFIRNDLQEAVYVYPDPTALRAALNDPDMPAGEDILAFWRPVPIDEADIPADIATCTGSGIALADCEELLTRRAAYSLVMYIHAPDQAGDVWDGLSRLVRYELPRYEKVGGNLQQRAGYVDPSGVSATTSQINDFEGWAPSAAVDGRDDVLVDYISVPIDTSSSGSPTALDCDALTGTTGLYDLSPPDAAAVTAGGNTVSTGFFACVRDPNPDLSELTEIDQRAQASGANFRSGQDVYLFLRGDASRSAGDDIVDSPLNSTRPRSRLPVLTTQVLVRGVVDRGGSN